MAPSMAQPTCSPKPIFTWKSGMRLLSSSFSRYARSLEDLLSMDWMMTNDASALSATLEMALRLALLTPSPRPISSSWISEILMACPRLRPVLISVGNRQTRRKASPMFLLADPPERCTSMCTMWAMVLTYSMTPSCSTSVASVNCRMSQNPKMASILLPGIMGSKSAPPLRLAATISAPASPKPMAISRCSLLNVVSRNVVS
mmetsp:Transcript_23791/g.45243  ORF Transcript_23791/g.45243 Transcript_23791/m.45243 type:complete len:203 (+) Transcript_23791:652-1260(+)